MVDRVGKRNYQVAKKVANKMLFGLRDNISGEAFRECVEGLEKVYPGGN